MRSFNTYPMSRKTEPHNLSSCSGAAKLWYNDTSYRASSNCKREYIPVKLYKGKHDPCANLPNNIKYRKLSWNIFRLSSMFMLINNKGIMLTSLK